MFENSTYSSEEDEIELDNKFWVIKRKMNDKEYFYHNDRSWGTIHGARLFYDDDILDDVHSDLNEVMETTRQAVYCHFSKDDYHTYVRISSQLSDTEFSYISCQKETIALPTPVSRRRST